MASPSLSAGHLDLDPSSELVFLLDDKESTSKCTMTLTHPGDRTAASIAFKVKTTQPRRYLVRPNQGLIGPGQAETVQIILVEKDKAALLQSYERLGGQAALDHCKDKFLVQSCTVSSEFVKDYNKAAASAPASQQAGSQHAGYEALTQLWTQLSGAGGSSTPVVNKKLHVRHQAVVPATSKDGAGAAVAAATGTAATSTDGMTRDQLLAEMSALRRKYDELVAFSVNLTAERDILNNTLEQTKRDLNAAQVAAAKKGGGRGGGGVGGAAPRRGVSVGTVVVICILAIFLGVQLEHMYLASKTIKSVPVVGDMMFSKDGAAEKEL